MTGADRADRAGAGGGAGLPMAWDPQARGGAGGWVEGEIQPVPPAAPPPPPRPPQPPRPTRALVRRWWVLGGCVALIGLAAAAALTGYLSHLSAARPGRPTAGESAGPVVGTSQVAPPPFSPSFSPSGTSASAPAAADQTAAVDGLLDSSAADRQQVTDAVNNIAACQSVAAAQAALTQVASHRAQLVERLAAHPLDQVDGGRDAAAYLRAAWQDSAAADSAFAEWAAGAAGCTSAADVAQDSAYQRGVDESAQATAAKRDFLARWNQIAPAYGLRSRAENDI